VGEARFIDRTRSQSTSVVLISLDIQGGFATTDRLTVLRQGWWVAFRETTATTPEESTGLITGTFEEARRVASERGAVPEKVRP